MRVFAFSGEASKGRIEYVLSQHCVGKARTLRTQDDCEIGTLHTDKAQTVGAHAHAEHVISAGLWHGLHDGFHRVFFFFKYVTSLW